MYDKIKGIIGDDSIFYSILILLVGVSSFGLGRWSVDENNSVQNTASVTMTRNTESYTELETKKINSAENSSGMYVGSKNGSKYHFPWCPGAKQMKEENKIWFQSKEDAQKAGYSPAANCKGI